MTEETKPVERESAATVTQCPKFQWCVMGHSHKGQCSSTSYVLEPPAADAGPRQHVEVDRSLLEGILNFMNRRFDGDRLLKHQAHFIGELHRVLDAPVPQEAAPAKTTLSERDQKVLVESLLNPPEPNENLRRLFTPATAPDWAMRVARQAWEKLIRIYCKAEYRPLLDDAHVDEIAALIREAGSERERALERVLRILLNEALLNWHCKPEDNCHECSAIQPTLAEASRLLGGGNEMNDNDTDPAGRWAGPIGRVMMTAEQLQAMKINQEREAAERIRRENAVALLAEKEREIAFLLPQRNKWAMLCQHFGVPEKETCVATITDKFVAADQRLQEAQARIQYLERNLLGSVGERSTS